MFAAGIKGSIDDAIDKTITGHVIVSNDDGFSDIPIATAAAVPKIDGVEVASPLRFTQDIVDGKGGTSDPDRAAAPPPRSRARLGRGLRRPAHQMGPNDAVIDTEFGDDNGIGVGDSFEAKTASGRTLTYTVIGTFTDNSDFIGDYAASDANADCLRRGPTSTTNVFVDPRPGRRRRRGQASDRGCCSRARFPTAKAEDQQGLKDSIGDQLNPCSGSSTPCCCSR